MNEELGEVLSPEEVSKRRERVRQPVEPKSDIDKIYSKAGCAIVDYESMGRFSTPPQLSFHDYTNQDVNDITLSRQEDLFENIVVITNRLRNKADASDIFDVSEMIIEDFMETLVAVKQEFNTPQHTHYWTCDCQNNLSEKDQQVFETEIDLRTLKYRSIEDAENDLREDYRKEFAELTVEEWAEYIEAKYTKEPKDAKVWTVEDELNTITVKEPILTYSGGDKYYFNFVRVKDIIKAQKLATKKFASKIKQITNRQEHGVDGKTLAEKKQAELDIVNHEKSKTVVLYAKALALYKKNDKVLSDEEKIEIFTKDIPREVTLQLYDFLDRIKFGIQDEREFTCPVCGKVDKRWLQREFTTLELLPFNTSTKRKRSKLTRLGIHFGEGA
jgi:exosome complex RNA-binding protein Csl4